MTHFFISYNQADRERAAWIAWQLEEAGYSIYLQAWDSRPAENFVIKMNEALRDSERMIAVLSPDYLNSLFSSPEWASAFARDPKGDKGILLPVRVRECDLRGTFFDSIHYIDLVGKNEAEAKSALLSGVQRGRAKPLTPPKFLETAERLIPEQPSFLGAGNKRLSIKSLIAVVVFFAVLGGGLYVFWPRRKEPPRSCLKSTSGDMRYYEAEDGELWGAASKDSEHPGFSGDGFVSGYGAEPDALTTFWVDVPAPGEYQIDLLLCERDQFGKDADHLCKPGTHQTDTTSERSAMDCVAHQDGSFATQGRPQRDKLQKNSRRYRPGESGLHRSSSKANHVCLAAANHLRLAAGNYDANAGAIRYEGSFAFYYARHK